MTNALFTLMCAVSVTFAHVVPTTQMFSGSGAQLITTQKFLDFVGQTVQEVGTTVLDNLQIPPITKDKDDFTFTVSNLRVSNVAISQSVSLISSDNTIGVEISSISASLTGNLHASEDIWPHYPTGDCTLTANLHPSSTATAIFSVKDAGDGIPIMQLLDCSAVVYSDSAFIDCTSEGLDIILDLVNDAVNQGIQIAIKDGICKGATGIAKLFSQIFREFSFQLQLPFPPPFNQAILDFRLTGDPFVIAATDSPSYFYFENPQTAEVYSASGQHYPQNPPGIPGLRATDLGGNMALAVLTPFPFDSCFWTFYHQGLLSHVLHRDDLPTEFSNILNTAFYQTYLPSLYAKYPDTNLSVLVNLTSPPTTTMAAGVVTIQNNISFVFNIDYGRNSSGPLAFELWAPFSDVLNLTSNGSSVFANLLDANITLQSGSSPFGNVTQSMISRINVPLRFIVNTIIHLFNLVLDKGVALPTFSRHIGQYGINNISAALVNARVSVQSGFVLIASDASIEITMQV